MLCVTCALCGADESTCDCMTSAFLMDFLADFRGRRLPPIAGVGIPAAEPTAVRPSPLPPQAAVAPALPDRAPLTEPGHSPDWVSALPADSWPSRPLSWLSRPLSWLEKTRSGLGRWRSWEEESRSGLENPRATASMFLGFASIVLPVLAVPSVMLGLGCLRHLALEPWRRGRARAIAGIVASAVLAPLSLGIWIWMSLT